MNPGAIDRWPASLSIGERRTLLRNPTEEFLPRDHQADIAFPLGFLDAEGCATSDIIFLHTAEVVRVLKQTPAPDWASPGWFIGQSTGGLIKNIVRSFRRQVSAGFHQHIGANLFANTVAASLGRALGDELDELLFRPLTLEKRIADLEGRGADWTHADFRDHLYDRRSQREFFENYPAVLRQLHLRCDRWLAASLEMVRRLQNDRGCIEEEFGIAAADRLVAAHATSGDPHSGGRRVTRLRFASGAELIYKPRPLGSTKVFQDLIGAMNRAGLKSSLRTVCVVDRNSYGWMEHVRSNSCRSDSAVCRYFRRAGSLLAALHVMGGSDCHFENVVAAGEQPIVVDLETLLAPQFKTADRSASAVAETVRGSSVLGVGMLPSIDGTELGALAAVPGQNTQLMTLALVDAGLPEARVERVAWQLGDVASLPLRRRVRVPAIDYVAEIEAGYSDGYFALQRIRQPLAAAGGILDRLGEQVVRLVLRPTAYYADMLRESTHPSALNDAIQADRVLAASWTDALDALRFAAAPSELRQLRAADVPYFSVRGASSAIRFGRARFRFARSGKNAAAERLKGLDENDLARQLGLLRASFGVLPGTVIDVVQRSRAVDEARLIGERLLSEAITTSDAATWIHLSTGNDEARKAIEPVEGSLYDGLLGIALFLGRLHGATGERRFAQLAHKALRETRSRTLDQAGIGVFDGLGGIVYALPHLACLLGDDKLIEPAEQAAEKITLRLEHARVTADLISGTAGLVLAGMSLHAVRRSSASERLLDAAARHLRHAIEHCKDPRVGSELPFSRGAAHGWSGVLLASARLSSTLPELMPREVVDAVASIDLDITSNECWIDPEDDAHRDQATWCHGAPGIALCRIAAAQAITSEVLVDGARKAVVATELVQLDEMLEPGLCHGSMGVMDIAITAGAMNMGGRPQVDAMACQRFSSDAPHTFRPGLMTGLAGIGYGLLRMSDPSTPDVLTLDPPSCGTRW